MSVLLETSLGDLVIDLEVEACPELSENFLKLCKIYYYNLNAFFNISKDFIAQTGDPTATGTGGQSFLSHLASLSPSTSSSVPRYFKPTIVPRLKHSSRGTVSMAVAPGPQGGCGSQFFITLAEGGIEYLDSTHAVFGRVVEGLDVLEQMNEVFVDTDGRPLKDVRIRHVVVLDDPFPDPPGLLIPPSSPTLIPDTNPNLRILDDEDALATLPESEMEAQRRTQAASASALTLEMIGDLPFANVRPPENVLFVCKLNPVTRDEDLELIFSRFGKIMSCEVLRDKKTGDSLQYAFVEFDKREEAEQAYFKMQNVLVDDRRIWVDFSQSIKKMGGSWGSAASSVGGGGRGGRGGRGGGGGGRGGFGGRNDLVASSRFRDEGYGGSGKGAPMGMVFDHGGSSGGGGGGSSCSRGGKERERDHRGGGRDERSRGGGDGGRRRSRSRSPPRRDSRDRDDRRDRDREREMERGGGGGDRERERERDRTRDRDRDRDRR